MVICEWTLFLKPDQRERLQGSTSGIVIERAAVVENHIKNGWCTLCWLIEHHHHHHPKKESFSCALPLRADRKQAGSLIRSQVAHVRIKKEVWEVGVKGGTNPRASGLPQAYKWAKQAPSGPWRAGLMSSSCSSAWAIVIRELRGSIDRSSREGTFRFISKNLPILKHCHLILELKNNLCAKQRSD